MGDCKNTDFVGAERVDNGIVRDRDVLGWCFLDWSLELNKQAGAQGGFTVCDAECDCKLHKN